MTEHFFASCPRGLEPVLGQELSGLGADAVQTADAGVAFQGNFALAMRANLESRVASRVLWQVDTGSYRTEQDIYDAARKLPWSRWMQAQQTLRVETRANRCPLQSLDFVTLRVKDAICDHFRDKTGQRPSVDTRDPDVRVHAFLTESAYFLYLDTSGEALFKRGTRIESGQAPLKKNLAAGILKLAGWQPGLPLLDPFCGAGTFLLEAAEQSLDRAPGLGRAFGFERLSGWDLSSWPKIRSEAEARAHSPRPLPIWGYDLKGEALDTARANLGAAGLADSVQLKQVNVLESTAPAPAGLIVTNPPYGVRMGEQAALAELYPRLGDVLKQRFAGWTAYFFTADMQLPKLIRLKTSRRTPLFNGALECRLFEIKVIAGSNR
ncbi:MAG: class I SAM-dependent RNA methyltransferase [Betaproteobacteria bacterium]|nr:class I SAM-dependent RNA methyltransferase [Betaproteobacteria bacterium]MDE2622091.1 class I SAM-dependent RNA methyltransferase [Betaproteobacteria bacterium]